MPQHVLTHASELLTGEGVRRKDGRRPREEDLGRIEDGAVVFETRKVGKTEVPGEVLWTGPSSKLPRKHLRDPRTDLGGARAVMPGMIDCHTHLVFAGDRSAEFAARCGGTTYAEIASKGGGILTTVRATREASAKELEELAAARLAEMAGYGVRTVEIKSGYGLATESELKMLAVIPALRKRFPQLTLRATFMGAHAIPADLGADAYVDVVLEEMLPQVAKLGAADSCDIFVDSGYFSVAQAERVLREARKLGLSLKVHAEELGNTGSASLAARLRALSADHLLKINDKGVRDLAMSDTVAVLLPGSAFYLKEPHAPARKLIEAGAAVALATDFNPGTCVCLSLPTIMTIAALYLGMTRAELFAAVTYNAAKALGLQDTKGTLEPGKPGDPIVLPFARFEDLYYRFAWAASPIAGSSASGAGPSPDRSARKARVGR
jgi:imidazolonepropionase